MGVIPLRVGGCFWPWPDWRQLFTVKVSEQKLFKMVDLIEMPRSPSQTNFNFPPFCEQLRQNRLTSGAKIQYWLIPQECTLACLLFRLARTFLYYFSQSECPSYIIIYFNTLGEAFPTVEMDMKFIQGTKLCAKNPSQAKYKVDNIPDGLSAKKVIQQLLRVL